MNNHVNKINFTLLFMNKNKLNVLILILKCDLYFAQLKHRHTISNKHRSIVAYTEILHSHHCNLSLVYSMTTIFNRAVAKIGFRQAQPTRYLSLSKTNHKPSEHVKENSQAI